VRDLNCGTDPCYALRYDSGSGSANGDSPLMVPAVTAAVIAMPAVVTVTNVAAAAVVGVTTIVAGANTNHDCGTVSRVHHWRGSGIDDRGRGGIRDRRRRIDNRRSGSVNRRGHIGRSR
jgi:hypothetical protein